MLERVGECPSAGLGLALILRDQEPELFVSGLADVDSGRAVDLRSYWDLASLTKVMLTLPLVLRLVREGRLDLRSALGSHWEAAARSPYRQTAIWELLAHASGAPADIDLKWLEGASSDELYAFVLEQSPTCDRPLYSDVGYIILGGLVEHLTSRPLVDHIRDSKYLKVAPQPNTAVATERCAWRHRMICGEPHDEKAYVFPNRVAGHAGAFASLPQVAGFVQSLVDRRAVDRLLVDVATRAWTPPAGRQVFGLGFRLPGADWFGGTLRGDRAFGATGFVGHLLWVEPTRGYGVVILSNRIHPYRSDRAPHDEWCIKLLDAAALALGDSPALG